MSIPKLQIQHKKRQHLQCSNVQLHHEHLQNAPKVSQNNLYNTASCLWDQFCIFSLWKDSCSRCRQNTGDETCFPWQLEPFPGSTCHIHNICTWQVGRLQKGKCQKLIVVTWKFLSSRTWELNIGKKTSIVSLGLWIIWQ